MVGCCVFECVCSGWCEGEDLDIFVFVVECCEIDVEGICDVFFIVDFEGIYGFGFDGSWNVDG